MPFKTDELSGIVVNLEVNFTCSWTDPLATTALQTCQVNHPSTNRQSNVLHETQLRAPSTTSSHSAISLVVWHLSETAVATECSAGSFALIWFQLCSVNSSTTESSFARNSDCNRIVANQTI